MGISKLLRKFDIKVIGKLTKEQQIILSDNVATKISNEFNYIDYGYIYTKLMKAKMYIAIIPEGITSAIYSYEEDTLFISDTEEISTVSKELLYECIHAVQDIRNKKGQIKQLGQCIFSEFKVYAMALNEASIQYIVAKIFNEEEKYIEAYAIKSNTYSPNKYPLICNILLQLLFISTEEILVKSTIYSTDEFIIEGIEEIGESSFVNVQNNLDEMLYASEQIIGIKKLIKTKTEEGYFNIEEYLNEIYEKEELIRKLYMDSQISIFTMYFDRLYNRIENLSDIKFYRNKLEEFKKLIGFYTNENQDYFLKYYEDYYKQKEEKLILKQADIERKNELALTVISDNIIIQIFNKIKSNVSRILKKV
ncbi:MAG: hypothetical protein HFJ41_06260 [Clostridia bacterium]|nr:hypothetical protein [Clostridia bacterium]